MNSLSNTRNQRSASYLEYPDELKLPELPPPNSFGESQSTFNLMGQRRGRNEGHLRTAESEERTEPRFMQVPAYTSSQV